MSYMQKCNKDGRFTAFGLEQNKNYIEMKGLTFFYGPSICYEYWNPKQKPDHTYYSCIRQNSVKESVWRCAAEESLLAKKLYQNYQPEKEEFQVTSVPSYIPSLLHKPYLTLSLSSSVKIIEYK